MVISYNLYTRNPEDIKEVTPYAIEATKAQSLRDLGIELLPFEEHEGSLTEEEYYSLRFHCLRYSISSFSLKTNDLKNLNLRQVTI